MRIICFYLLDMRWSHWPRNISMNCLLPLEHLDRGFESHLRHGCLCALILCVVLCVDSGLRRPDLPSRESYRLSIGIRNWKSGQGPTKVCRGIDRFIECLITWTYRTMKDDWSRIFIISLFSYARRMVRWFVHNELEGNSSWTNLK
jgi:hypothetical protein